MLQPLSEFDSTILLRRIKLEAVSDEIVSMTKLETHINYVLDNITYRVVYTANGETCFKVVNDKDILGFFGENRWLSNFHQAAIVVEMGQGRFVRFATTEAAYQASKSNNPEVWKEFGNLTTGRDAKFLSYKINPIRPDWDLVKYDVMLKITRLKFQHPDLRTKLLATGTGYLEETNTWGDTYWGVYNGSGLNKLGEILMQVRDEIRQERV